MRAAYGSYTLGLIGLACLSACSSSNNSGGPADLSTPEAAATQAASMVSALDAMSGISDGSTTTKTHEEGHCDQGEFARYQATNVDVGSPYTQQTFELNGVDWLDCRTNFPEQNDTSGYVQLSGRSAAGAVDESGSTVSYARVGEDAGTPLAAVVRVENNTNGQSFSTDFEYGIGLVQHARRTSNGDRQTELFSMFSGQVSTGPLEFDFSVRFGSSESERFRLGRTSAGETVDGQYALSMDDIPGKDVANCTGEARVATEAPLVRNDQTVGFSSGTLKFSADGQDATVVFNGDEVTITTASGSQTFTQSDLFSLGDECSGLFLGGLAFTDF